MPSSVARPPAATVIDSKTKPIPSADVPPSGSSLPMSSLFQGNGDANPTPGVATLPPIAAKTFQSDSKDSSEAVEPRDALPPPSSPPRPPTAKKRSTQSCFSPSETNLIYIFEDDITSEDILCGRELAGSDHPGNVAYLRMVAENKALHHTFGSQHGEKTKIRNMIVHELVDRGGRFVRMVPDGQHHLLTVQEARRKVSQSL